MPENTIPSDPTERIGFEIDPHDAHWSFRPMYYPATLRQAKDRELDRSGRQCSGENVSIKEVKNREYHVSGAILASEVPVFQSLCDYEGELDLISPIVPSGGIECIVHETELGNLDGWDPIEKEWRFSYTVDLVSTGRDEHDHGDNNIVTEIIRQGGGGGGGGGGMVM